MKVRSVVYLVLLGMLAACAGPAMPADFEGAQEAQSPGQPAASGGAGETIGTIELIKRSIQHNDREVEQIDDLYRDDSLFIHGGGEGLLNLLDNLRMRIFNTTELGGFTVQDLPGTPLLIQAYLERGGFTGEFASLDGTLNFRTPGGAVIQIRGTRFIVVYDDVHGIVWAGNFSGSVAIESAGSGMLDIPDGMMRAARDGSPPGPAEPLWFNQQEYEGNASQLQSPVEALEIPGDNRPAAQVETQPPPPPSGVTDAPIQPTTQAPPPAAQPPTALVLQNAHCRAGPSQAFEPVRTFPSGVQLEVDGRLADQSWWRVIVPDNRKSCWIWVQSIELSGDLERVPVLASPPTPSQPPTETPTPNPTPTDTPYIPDEPPPAPSLYSPGYGETIYCGTSSSSTVTLSWSEVSDYDGIYSYEYELIDTYMGIVVSAGAFNTTSIDVSVDCAYAPGVEYLWRVRAIDNAMNYGPWSSDGYFYTVQVIG